MDEACIQVLLVEDSPTDALIVREELPGGKFQVESVERLSEALERLQEHCFDVVLLDLSLPDSDGLETFTNLQKLVPNIPILLLTGRSDEQFAIKAVKAGAQDYLVKGLLGDKVLIRAIRYAIERKRAEEKLAEQAALLDKARDAILVRDLDHNIKYWNKSAERLYGWSVTEAIGRSVRELMYGDPSQFDAAMSILMKEGDWVGELIQITKDGRSINIEGRWTLLKDNFGNPRSVLSINTDITDRKKLEQQFLRAQRMESIGTLAGGIAHDLNNVLAPIVMSLDLLQMRFDDPASRETLETIAASARRGADMVNQVLSFARGVEGERIPIQAKHLLRDIEKFVLETFPKNIQCQFKISPDIWLINGDATQLYQVLLNLLVNSRDAMANGGTIKVLLENTTVDEHYAAMNMDAKAGKYVVIQVEDTGAGIPADIIEKIYEPFFTTKEIGKGTGLGLSTSLAIVKSHGGFMQVYSEPGNGTRFKVNLPVMDVQSDEVSETPEQCTKPRGEGELILVVDDEAPIRQVTRHTLEAFGYRVIVAENGADGLAVFAVNRDEIAVVLTDMMMPVMDGTALIQALRRIAPETPIIAASGITANGQVIKALEAGMEYFVAKPYTAEKILTMLHTILRAKSRCKND